MTTHKKKTVQNEEQTRLQALCEIEQSLREQGHKIIVGVDEAGRGPLAGPVVAACCYIPEGIWISGIDDSKKLTPVQRARIHAQLVSNSSVKYAVGIASVEEIDTLNIYWATRLAMRRAVEALSVTAEYLLVDGMALEEIPIPNIGIVQGDSLSYSIAAASIIAKEHRDALMIQLDQQWPGYGFAQHKGYGTKGHLQALNQLGPCDCHRKTFEPVKSLNNSLIFA